MQNRRRKRQRNIFYPTYIARSLITGHGIELYEGKIQKIYKLLPHLNCGRCGYPTCVECAEAIVDGKIPENACAIVGEKIKDYVKEILSDGR